jgi:hypothetical protein
MKTEHACYSSASTASPLIQKVKVGRLFAVVALFALAMLSTAGRASAGCAAYTPGAPFAPNFDEGQQNGPNEPVTIVGLWHVIYTATYSTSGPLPVPVIPPGPPSSFQFIQSYKTWHADGTEWENAFLPPGGGNVCFGVWKDLGRGSVKLHHIGLMFDPSTGSVANVFTVDEINAVAPNGKTYKGSFDLKIFEPTDVLAAGTVLQEIKGTTAATRITVD